jgi:lipopolysaccharide transport system permease protein
MERAVESPRKPYLSIRPTRGWAALDLSGIWQFRDLLMALAGRDVKLRYKQTVLGIAWVVLQPLVTSAAFAFVFGLLGHMPHGDTPYLLITFAGLLGWNLFNTTVTKSSTCLVGNAQLVSKIYFPRLVLPLSTVPSALIDFLVALAMLVILMAIYRVAPGMSVIALPFWILLLLMLSAGIGLWTAALTVSYRDVQYILPVMMQVLLYISPAGYLAYKAVPARYQPYYFLNPLAAILEGMRWSLLGTPHPDWKYVAYSAVVSLLLLIAGAFMFKRMERKFADVI